MRSDMDQIQSWLEDFSLAYQFSKPITPTSMAQIETCPVIWNTIRW